jgi:LPPG:FO 2-phospho-L-lactate transferase
VNRVAVLAGGTGGAKLAAGLQDLLGDGLSVIANTGDDVELLGVHVSPDPDLVTYWLTGEIDEERGWGIAGDGFNTFERMALVGAPDWFSLSDRDLGVCLYRRMFLGEGGRQTDAQAQIARQLGASAAVLPMCDEPVRTRIKTAADWRGLQEFLIVDHAAGPIEAIEVEGLDKAKPTTEVLEALQSAEAIVIGPSNPVISIGPILSVPGMREAIASSPAPVVAVSPFVGGRSLKGPTEACMAAVGRPPTAAGVASLYEGLLDGMVHDAEEPEPPPALPVLACTTLMEGADGRRALAERTLKFAATLDKHG